MEVDKLDIDKLQNLASGLSSLKYQIDKLDIGKLKITPIDLTKLSDVVKLMLLKRLYMVNWLKKLMPLILENLLKNRLRSKIKDIEDRITDITNLATTAALTAVEDKVPNVNALVKKQTMITK